MCRSTQYYGRILSEAPYRPRKCSPTHPRPASPAAPAWEKDLIAPFRREENRIRFRDNNSNRRVIQPYRLSRIAVKFQ
jgi:hypothetical protein